MMGFLGSIDPRKWQDSNIRLRQPGTGVWFIECAEFKSWLSIDQSKLWIYGIRMTVPPSFYLDSTNIL